MEFFRKESSKTGVDWFRKAPTLFDLIVSTLKRLFTARTNFFHNGLKRFNLPAFCLIEKMNNNELQFTFAIFPESKIKLVNRGRYSGSPSF